MRLDTRAHGTASMTNRYEAAIDRRDEMRRRIYLILLAVGLPALAATWWLQRSIDPFIAIAFPAKIAVQSWVGVGLYRRTLAVRTAERIALVVIITIYMAGFAVGVLARDDLAAVNEPATIFSLLTINMMAMLAYVAFDTRRALQVSLGVLAAFTGIVGVRLVPALVAGQVDAVAVDHLRALVFLGASVGLLHVLAQTKEQAAEARSAAAAMAALAHTDALTGIANRRLLHTTLEQQLAETLADEAPLAVILRDVDHFKQVNDTHGHDVGDAVLRVLADVLRGSARDGDLVGRWGGEEFLVIAPRTTLHDAAVLAERCRMAIADTTFPVAGQVTASLGVAVHQLGDSAWQLLRRADDALYLAKRSGRDLVRQHGGGPEPTARIAAERTS